MLLLLGSCDMYAEVISAGILIIPFSLKVLKSRLKKNHTTYLEFGDISSLDEPVLQICSYAKNNTSELLRYSSDSRW